MAAKKTTAARKPVRQPTDRRPKKQPKADRIDGVYLDVPWKGRSHRLTPGDFSALDDEALFDRLGFGVVDAFAAPSLRGIAGLLWLVKRRRNDELTFEDVAGAFTLADFAEVVESDGADDGQAADAGDSS